MNTQSLLRKWRLRPNKALGQNFLVDQEVLDRITRAAQLTPNDIVLEIGAGTGTLTKRLARNAGFTVSVELDRQLMPILDSELSQFDKLVLIQGDILRLDPASLINEATGQPTLAEPTYKVVANLPYYATSAVLRHLLEAERKPRLMVITVQKEVAERIVAAPGNMSILAVSVQFYGEPELLFRVGPDSFYPPPEVESAVLRVEIPPSPPLPDEQVGAFFQVVRAGFSQRRKQLHNSLSAGLGTRVSKQQAAARLENAGIDHRRRAQTLSIAEWIALTRAFRDVISA
ncbi:MAG: 16S rRNA (adenine(1518)-N(6)/adenine(1519)-N(6))-dimethyltransferase RsmA [Anaerolineae bacterium]|jgi:16S rRNA (adenine1518-N6/adenine1519-N6)-dimethyltransferase